MACVNVCPMGIDIRDGQQLECITCALCIDACDEIMAKTGRDRGLIDYLALSDEPAERAGAKPRPVWQHVFRTRVIVYTAMWAAIGIALVFALFIRSDVEMTVAPVRNPTFVTLSAGSIRNTYDVRIRSKSAEAATMRLGVTGDPALRVQLEGSPYEAVAVPADATFLQRVYVVAPAGSTPAETARLDIRLWITALGSDARTYKDTTFNGRDGP